MGTQVRAETRSVCRKLAAESLFKRELILNAVSRGVSCDACGCPLGTVTNG
jgi:hypothetical protein